MRFFIPASEDEIMDDSLVYPASTVAELRSIDPDVTADEADIGKGASWPGWVIHLPSVSFDLIQYGSVALTGLVATTFFAGEPIRKNLDAWLDIARRVRGTFASTAPETIDNTAAILVAIDAVRASLNPEIELSVALQVVTQRYMQEPLSSDLEDNPDRVFVVTLTTDAGVFIVTVDQRGRVASIVDVPAPLG